MSNGNQAAQQMPVADVPRRLVASHVRRGPRLGRSGDRRSPTAFTKAAVVDDGDA